MVTQWLMKAASYPVLKSIIPPQNKSYWALFMLSRYGDVFWKVLNLLWSLITALTPSSPHYLNSTEGRQGGLNFCKCLILIGHTDQAGQMWLIHSAGFHIRHNPTVPVPQYPNQLKQLQRYAAE
jgi:hypothetical protein